MAETKRAPTGNALERLGLDFASRLEIDKRVAAGVRVAAVRRFLAHSGFTETDLIRAIRIPQTTWTRRKKAGKLAPEESDRLASLARIFSHAENVLGGPGPAKEWLERAEIAFEGRRPLDVASTRLGAEEVDELLTRLEFGVF
ncbi:MAG: type II RES/Xre toxin-antitoxin system antitoxin [Thermoplasmatota archaeon]